MIQYFFRDAYENEICDEFDALTRQYPNIHFFQPSPDKAPWHVQAVLDAADGEPIVLNFWPHKRKAQRQGEHSKEGDSAAREIIDEAIADQRELLADSRAFDVIEAAE
nr:hypothetical protein [uncultured Roseovarius sp.]